MNFFRLLFLSLGTVGAVALGAGNEAQYGLGGCGLGSQLVGKKDNQILAYTTNVSSTQTFSITSGTSNCVSRKSEREARAIQYIDVNKVALATDIARGMGESLSNLAYLVGCSASASLAKKLQKNYKGVFSGAKDSADQIYFRIDQLIRDDQNVSKECGESA